LRIICKAGNLGHSMLRVYRFHGPEGTRGMGP
jgi:hypothetical protein